MKSFQAEFFRTIRQAFALVAGRPRTGTQLMLALGLVATPITRAADFSLASVPFPALSQSSVISGDFNNDSKADVFLTGADASFNGVAQVWQGSGAGAFVNADVTLPGISASAVARGDFDNDGRADLLITGMTGLDASNRPVYATQLWRNQGNGTFVKINLTLPGIDTSAVA